MYNLGVKIPNPVNLNVPKPNLPTPVSDVLAVSPRRLYNPIAQENVGVMDLIAINDDDPVSIMVRSDESIANQVMTTNRELERRRTSIDMRRKALMDEYAKQVEDRKREYEEIQKCIDAKEAEWTSPIRSLSLED